MPDDRYPRYDALLVVSFGGPNGPDDVLPFLENVTRGRNIPRQRLLEVAEHYLHFGGRSPINHQNFELLFELRQELAQHGHHLPIYFGNRNWHPLLADTLRCMQSDGVRRALVWVTSTFGSYSGCRQYRENLAAALAEIGGPTIDLLKLRAHFNHPGFIAAQAERVRQALAPLSADHAASAQLLFTAHSIPLAMAASGPYVAQLLEACRLVAAELPCHDWRLVYQSRSGPPQQPWLEPDVCDALREVHAATPGRTVVLVPIGFVSDHMEVVYDLDTEARDLCETLGLHMVRAGTVGTHPAFVAMLRQLVEEQLLEHPPLAVGELPPTTAECPAGCCQYTAARPSVGAPRGA